MDQRVKAVVFDWGRTLYDPERGALFPSVVDLARRLSERYRLAIVSLITDEAHHVRLNERLVVLREHDLERYFTAILFAPAE